MDDLYDDLENYNDVNLVNELRTENAELKHKLEECLLVMNTLQKDILQDFDNMAADFKILETNYSSLLKIARAEIKRKTDMITNLNVEKDILILKQLKPEERKKKFNDNLQNSDRPKKKNTRSNVKNLKQPVFNSKENARVPSEASSTTTDRSHRLIIVENTNVSKHNDNRHREDVFPDHSGNYHSERYVDRRVSMLTGHQFAKFSSDEEFEDMYSALEPRGSSKESFLKEEPVRSRKRTRHDPQHAKAYYDPHTSNSETFKDHYGKNRNSNHFGNERSANPDQYDSAHSHRNKHSPERHRRGRREFGEDRQQRDRQRRLESPSRGRYQHKSRERRPYPEREDHKTDMQKYTHHIVKHNDEPLNKRPRVEHYPHPGEDRRQIDRQLVDNQYSIEMGGHVSCQSPDHLHSEHISFNEPIREIKSTAVTKLEDPRVSSGKYLRCTDGNKDTFCSLSANKVNLQPVNKTLWELKKDEPLKSLSQKPLELSSEVVNEIYMDLDNPSPDLSIQSKYGTDVTDYPDEDLIEHDATEVALRTENEDKSISKNDTASNEENKVQSIPNTTEKAPAETENEHKPSLKNVTNRSHEEAEVRSVPNTIEKAPTKTENEHKSISKKVTDRINEQNKVHSAPHITEKAPTKTEDEHNSVFKNATDGSNEKEKVHKSTRYNIPKFKKTDKLDNNHGLFAKSISTIDKATPERKHINSNIEHKELMYKNFGGIIKIDDISKSTEETKKNKMLLNLEASTTVTNVTIQREFEHTVYSIRHIVEGDLALSDETNDETQVELKEEKKKHRTRKKSQRDCSKDKNSDTMSTRKTRSKKEKEVTSTKLISELFGESSSLITPEELALATTQAHARAAEFAHVCEDAQDGIKSEDAQNQTSTMTRTEPNPSMEPLKEERKKTKASKDKTRTPHSKHKKLEHTTAPNESSVIDTKQDGTQSKYVNKELVDCVAPLESTVKISGTKERSDQETSTTGKANKNKTDEESKGSAMTNKRSKSGEVKLLICTESAEKCFANKNVAKAEYKKPLSTSENKENASYKDTSTEGNSDMPQFCNDTLIPFENLSFDSNKASPTVKSKETICGARIEEIPNFVPDKEERGLVKTVVISTGIQPMDPDVRKVSPMEGLYAPLKALATSTPAKELSSSNTLDQIVPNTNISFVNGKTMNKDGESRNETDVPDIRITMYRRRRKVLKK